MVVGSFGFVLGHGSSFFSGFRFWHLRQLKSLLGHLTVGSLLGFFVLCACVVLIGDVCLCCFACVVFLVLFCLCCFACVVLLVLFLLCCLLVLFCPGAPTLFCLSKIK